MLQLLFLSRCGNAAGEADYCQQSLIFRNHLRKLAERQRIFTKAGLNCEAGAAEALDEPVLIPAVGRLGRHVLQRIAADGGKCSGERFCLRQMDFAEAVVDDAPLRMIGEKQIGMHAARIASQRHGLRLTQCSCARIVARRRRGKAARGLNAARVLPSGWIVEV